MPGGRSAVPGAANAGRSDVESGYFRMALTMLARSLITDDQMLPFTPCGYCPGYIRRGARTNAKVTADPARAGDL